MTETPNSDCFIAFVLSGEVRSTKLARGGAVGADVVISFKTNGLIRHQALLLEVGVAIHFIFN